ncbi:preprotein translocase subunit SecA [Candidatus Gracilibacteria bacterium]|nr:preprotein translocase subunit SecA [Candidatus Gracilibacteria bacterium]
MIQKFFDSVFGGYNEKQLRKLQPIVDEINAQEKELQAISEEALKKKFTEWREELTAHPEKIDDLLVPVFAGVKNAARKFLGEKFDVRGRDQEWNMVHFDVQLLGGVVLHQGKIAEMKTGEGKTLVCTLPVVLNALSGKGVHVITVNDYLAQRDAEWMSPLYEFCGLRTGVIVHGKTNEERQEAYHSDITYGTNNEFGFDYLRDNMAQNPNELVQRDLNYAIVDEVDSILIDEARTPLIISAPAEESTEKYQQHASIIRQLKENEDYNIDLKIKSATLTEKGVAKLESILGTRDLFTESGFEEVHHIENALKANVIFERDKDYVVRDGEVLIVDEFTGRLMPGRRYSDGLHQALEAKENVEIKRESRTLATITFQNYFRLYDKLAGMTGTAETEAEEFAKIYKLDTIVVPTNEPLTRKDFSDKIFKNERGKFQALTKEVQELNQKGQPVLIGTINIDKSELLSDALKSANIPHNVLNAKQHEREAEIVAGAGQKGSVTIATNMAGRGTDIKLGEGVKELGGLAILGTERHESRRIDNQLRGRSGRQGDPGFSQFYISMQDDLMRRFGGERMSALMDRLNMPEDEPVQNAMISRSVENAQKKIEGFHFDARKHVVQYDDVMNVHREKIYGKRRKLLGSESILEDIEIMIRELVEQMVTMHCPTPDADSKWNTQEVWESINAIHKREKNTLTLEELQAFTHRDEMIESLQNYLLSSWDEKKKSMPEDQVDKISKYVVLRSIDELWLEHINAMTTLRDRVALSGYAQKDPVMEYKREAFEMFRLLLQNVRRTSVTNLFRIEFRQNIEMETADYSDAVTNDDQIDATLTNAPERTPTFKPRIINADSGTGRSVISEKLGEKYANVGRNDQCPCGSGKKFKKCHGGSL